MIRHQSAFYSPWGIRMIKYSGEPMIILGTNIPELLPLREGSGNVFSYQKQDGDDDIALSGTFNSYSVGTWMENTSTDLTFRVRSLTNARTWITIAIQR
jgi:hypothetical protein